MAKPSKTGTSNTKKGVTVSKRTSIGSGRPSNKHQRRQWKAYRGQGRV